MRKIMAANWKMHKTRAEAAQTADDLRALLTASSVPSDRSIVIFPPFTAIDAVAEALRGVDAAAVGGQDVYPAAEGAFTGEISPVMLRDAGAAWVLTGHSERRHILKESLEFIARKTAFSLAQGMNVLLCVGETLEEREEGRLEAVLEAQVSSALAALPASHAVDAGMLAVAYEPVWAIGSGKAAGPVEILEAHALTRRLLVQRLGSQGENTPILYGGSVNAENAASVIALDNVDGVLVGGASLQAESFMRIARA